MVTAMYRLAMNLGTTVTPLIGTALISVSYSLLFWAEALAALIYGLIALKFLPGRPKQAQASAGAVPQDSPAGYRDMLTDVRYMAFLAAILLVAIIYCQYTAALPLAIVKAGLSLWWYSAVIVLNGVIVAAFEVPATKYVQAWPVLVTAVSGFGLVALGFGIYAIAMVPVVLILGTLIWTSSEIVAAPTTWSYPGLVAPPRLRGRYFGAMQSVFGLGNAVGPILGVALWYHVGQQVWLWGAGVGLLATVAALAGMRPTGVARRSEQPAEEPAA
jgi:predicted MFS family arabinose efflux permease